MRKSSVSAVALLAVGAVANAKEKAPYQDFGGFPLVPDPKLEHWAAMLEGNRGR